MSLSVLRIQKDAFFREDPYSPLTDEQKESFDGLYYFPENESLRYTVSIERFPDDDVVRLQTNTGEVQAFERYGRFSFEVAGTTAELTIFASHDSFFLPFADSLAGKETYGAGRYLEPEQIENGLFFIDFNLAYNPYCAYNDHWTCPLTPGENRLEVPIRAGEKIFQSEHRSPNT